MKDLFPVPTDIDYMMLLPTVLVVLTGIVGMVIELLRPKQTNGPIVAVTVGGLVLAGLAGLAQLGDGFADTFSGMVIRDRLSIVVHLVLIVACLLTVLFSEGYLRDKKIPFAEFYFLCVWATAGAMMMVSSQNLLVIFIGLEILSISLYVLAGLSRQEQKSEECALKYFLLGAFASGIFLYGISMLYGATGSLELTQVPVAAVSNHSGVNILVLMGVGLVVIGMGFKSALVPFHQWTPDVYQGAPTNVTAFMAVASKAGAMTVLLRVLMASRDLIGIWMPALITLAILTMVVGNSVALLQKDLKRIMGYSSIAHAGYILTAILAHVKDRNSVSEGTFLYYLVSYTFMTIGSFAVISLLAKDGKESTSLDDLKGLWQRSPFAAGVLVLFMVSLIGIPPFSGFWGKLLIFKDAMTAGLPSLAIVLAATSILSVAYYLQVAWAAFVADPSSEKAAIKLRPGLVATCVICAVGIIVTGLLVGPVYDALYNGYSIFALK